MIELMLELSVASGNTSIRPTAIPNRNHLRVDTAVKERNPANSFNAAPANLMAEKCHFLKGLLVPFKGKGELLAQVQEADQVHQWCKHQVRQLVAEFKNTFPDGRGFLPVSLQSQRAVSGEYIRWRKVGGDQRYVELQSPDGFALLSNLPPVVQQTLFEFNERVLQTNATRSLAYHRHRTLNGWLVKRQQADRVKASLR